MAGFLPVSWANFFTQQANYEIEFGKFGQTATTKGISSYSSKQLMDRLYIWGGIALGGVSGFLLDCLRTSDASGWSNALLISAGVVGGFLYTHHQVTKERIGYRKRINDIIADLISEIENQVEKTFADSDKMMGEVKVSLVDTFKTIEKLEATDCSGSIKAMQTLCLQLKALESVSTHLKAQAADKEPLATIQEFWQQEPEKILADLKVIEAPQAKLVL